MSDAPSSLLPTDGLEKAPCPASVLAILRQALEARGAAPRRALACGREASTTEGLELLKGYLAIEDVAIRQALVDAVTILSRPSD